MMKAKLNECEYYITCEMWPCHNRADYSIGKEGSPKSQYTHICKECTHELLEHMKSVLESKDAEKVPFEDEPAAEEVKAPKKKKVVKEHE